MFTHVRTRMVLLSMCTYDSYIAFFHHSSSQLISYFLFLSLDGIIMELPNTLAPDIINSVTNIMNSQWYKKW